MLSRVADSLFWMSRYIERAENNARMLDVNLQMMLDVEGFDDRDVAEHWLPIINSLEDTEVFYSIHKKPDADSVAEFITFDRRNPSSICSCLAFARENARTVREQISTEMWEEINKVYLFVRSDEARQLYRSSPYEFYKMIVEGSYLFQGVTDTTMSHGEGWDFIQLGKFIERGDRTSRILDIKYHILLPQGEEVGGNVDTIQWMAVLRSCSANEAYRKVHVGQVHPWRVAEFLITDERFPRSIRFCVDHLDAALHRISGTQGAHFGNEAERLSGRLRSHIIYSKTEEILDPGLHQYLDDIQLKLNDISDAIYELYASNSYPDMEAQIAAFLATKEQ